MDGARVRFVVISDGHLTSAPRLAVRAALRSILALERRPVFVVDTGDSTELGWAEELAVYRREVVEPLRAEGIGLSAVPGNHDARWSPSDTRLFEEVTGPLPAVARCEGLALLLLRSALPGEQHGHLEASELDQLRRIRGSFEPWVPTFGFLHHPVIEGDPYVTGCAAAHALFRELHVTALFVGHGHGWDRWRVNGIHQLMTGAAMGGAYRIVDVERDRVETWGVQVEWDETAGDDGSDVANLRSHEIDGTRLSFPLRPEPVPILSIAVASPRATEARLAATWPEGEPPAGPLEAELRLRGATPIEVELPVERAGQPGRTAIALPLEGAPAGAHTLTLRAESPAHGTLLATADLTSDAPEIAVDWVRYLDGSVFATPLLADGTVYCATRGGTVYAIGLEGAEFRWGFACEGPVQSAPQLDEGRLYFGAASGTVHAIETRRGSSVWRVPAGGPVRSTPALRDGRVFVGSGDGVLHCLDSRTGESLWQYRAGRLIESRPVVADGRVLFGSWAQKLHCLHAYTGEELWTAPIGRQVYFSPATAAPTARDGRAFVSATDSTVYAFDLASGEPLWQAAAQAGYTSPTWTPEGTLVYGTMNGELVGLDPETGEDRFRTKLGGGTFNSSPVCVGNRIAVGGLKGWVFLADAATGAQIARLDLGESFVFATPAFDGTRLIAGTMDGRLIAARLLV